MFYKWFFLCGCLLPLSSLAAGLTEADALRLALTRTEFVALQRAHLDEADGELQAAGMWPNPDLELNRERLGSARERSWQISQRLDLSGRRGLYQSAAAQRVQLAAAENRQRYSERATSLRLAFHTLLWQQAQIHATETWVARFARIERIVDKQARAGEASGYDRRRLAREQQAAQAQLAVLRAQETLKRSQLAALIGQSIDAPLLGELLPALPAALDVLQEQLASYAPLAALQADIAALENEGAAARNNLPELTVGLGRKQQLDGPLRESGSQVMLSFNLPLFDRQQARQVQTDARLQAARAEFELTHQQARGELRGLHQQLKQLINIARDYRQQTLASAHALVRIAETAYSAGEFSILELLDACQLALEAERVTLELEWQARSARIELDRLTENAENMESTAS